MPVIAHSEYLASFPFSNGHVQTLYPPVFRTVPETAVKRQRIETPDDDFLDIDFHYADEKARSGKLAVVSHGLEGHSRRKYVRGMALSLTQAGWDVAAWNFRGCSGEPNKRMRMYHSGVTDDLHTVVAYCATLGYEKVALVGFSMGGNQILKYLGEDPDNVHLAVKAAAVFSVPCDLPGCGKQLAKRSNGLYTQYFLRSLRQKVRDKHPLYPKQFPLEGLESMKTLREFDNRYTAPVHGFVDADDYYRKSGCLHHLHRIEIPSLLVNAANDPFLSKDCYPVKVARENDTLYLEIPHSGGHVGFVAKGNDYLYWSDKRAAAFLQSLGL